MIFHLPDLGEGLTEAEIVQWLVAEGDVVAVDQSIAEVETAKSMVEVPSPYAGKVVKLHGKAGSTLAVGEPLITVEPVSVAAEAYREEEKAGSGSVLVGYGTSTAASSGRHRTPRRPVQSATHVRPAQVVSPLVRNLARSNGVDLTRVEPTGRGGVIVRADVERAMAGGTAPASGENRVPLNGFRKAATVALSRSRAEIPEATVWVDVDATRLWELRESVPDGPGLLAYIARFTVAALRDFPVLNARFDAERQEIVELGQINLGIAVQGDRGLTVPAVIGAESMNTTRLGQEIKRLTAAAREGRVSARELSAGTFTLNNYGSLGVDGSAAIINYPQVAILGFGRILDRPWVVDGGLCVRKITQMSFVFDHRVCDGGTAAGFMRRVADAIENPASAIARL
ncbi:dihydrolipoamide acetyltransferase family protein [Actinoplanes sp. HUAS TT8]|uniref:dihydrolipoamide acetyltransferase family protein n=1 Tax=Actinoplanes sp. HUAS TT8 TaxID=3447453 RepID=UPI003F51F870